jgi:hypothetical protein
MEIEFKIILKELNNERQRYLVLSRKELGIFFLKSSDQKVDGFIRFSKIEKIERDLRDHRNISIKLHNIQNCIYIVFSSIYKLL